MTDFHYIDDLRGLEAAAPQIAGQKFLFLDTEFESTREQTRLCLLQIGTDAGIWLIDALKVPNLRLLRDAFAEATWVVHAGMQDVPLILRAVELRELPRILDTQIAYALVSAEANVSLAYLTYRLLGKRSTKAHQADDWTRRPLSEQQLTYAAQDVAELPRLMARLEDLATALSPTRFDLIFEASREALLPPEREKARLSLDMFRNAWQLGPAEQAGMRFLIGWYNSLSFEEQRDAPDTKVLLSLASRMPTTLGELAQLKGVPHGFAQRHHKHILDGLARAALGARSEGFEPIDPPPYATFQEFRLEAWLLGLRARVGQELTVSPEFVLPTRTMRELRGALPPDASGPTTVQEAARTMLGTLKGFRASLLGARLAELCESTPPPL